MIFWISILLSVLCILKTKKSERQINRWDVLFFLSSWQAFDYRIWRDYLAGHSISYPFELSGLILITLTLVYIRRRGISLGIHWSRQDARVTFFALVLLATALIPIGMQTGFLRFNPQLDAAHILVTAAGYYLIVAPTEELVFRGILQNLLARSINRWAAMLVANCAFAVIYTHVTSGSSFPNWTYIGMAFVAGLGYGISYLKSGNIWAPILVHGSVDTIWRTFLT